MSDLSATNCGCGSTGYNTGCSNTGCGGTGCGMFNNSCIWIILLFLLGGNNKDCGCGSGFSLFGGRGGNNNCEWLIWILLLSTFCGGNGGCGC